MTKTLREMDESILFYAFRYALGRRTYAVAEVCSEIIRLRGDLTEKTRILISDEIKKARYQQGLGDQCDVDQWENVFNALNCDEEKI